MAKLRVGAATVSKTAPADQLRRTVNALVTGPLADGLLVEDVSFTAATSTRVAHRLGRPLQGFIVVRSNADANLWEDQAPTEVHDPRREVALICSATAVLSIYFF